jgi:hypothetical protein
MADEKGVPWQSTTGGPEPIRCHATCRPRQRKVTPGSYVRRPAGRGRLAAPPRQEAFMADESHGDFAEGERTTPKGPERDFAEGEEQAPPSTKRDFAEGEEDDRPGHERDFGEGLEKPSD